MSTFNNSQLYANVLSSSTYTQVRIWLFLQRKISLTALQNKPKVGNVLYRMNILLFQQVDRGSVDRMLLHNINPRSDRRIRSLCMRHVYVNIRVIKIIIIIIYTNTHG